MLSVLLIVASLCQTGPGGPPAGPPQQLLSPEEATKPTAEVTEYASDNFRLVTDLPKEEAEALLAKLETLIENVTRYWGRNLKSTIDMYVARNLPAWPQEMQDRMAEEGKISILTGGGLTITQRISRGSAWKSRTVVYATSERGTAQHEAVHAYCGLCFGRTGPTWYAEGMAEVGQYWNEDDPTAVRIDPYVLKYLQSAEPTPLKELVSPNQKTGDSWQAYAWRWVLCHQLGFNPNYSRRFKPLGLGLLTGRNTSFVDVYGPMGREIDFEYRLFVENLCQGYRVDLCHWNWESRVKDVRPSGSRFNVLAKRGWQATPIAVRAGRTYKIASEGTWKVDATTEVDADGAKDGRGKLIATLFNDYELTEPFELGKEGKFSPQKDGQIVFRCRDGWDALADNEGKIRITITPAE